MFYDCSVTKRKGCNYCLKNKSIYYKKYEPIQEIYIEDDGSLTISHPLSDFDVNIKINYCPICGKEI